MAEGRGPREEAFKEFKLDADTELRFEVKGKSKVTLQLKSGLAEIFGTALVKNKKYSLSSVKVAVFTWYGCTLKLCGKIEGAYVSKETPMVVYSNIHDSLEQMRLKGEQNKKLKGPTVLVVGPTDVGKSTLCKILLNYAVRVGRRPMFVDLDVGQGQISLPGTVGALLVEKAVDVEEGFSRQVPLVYHYGHKSPANNIILYKMLVSQIAEVIIMRLKNNRKAEISGTIINTCGWVESKGYELITHAAAAFKVDVVLVIDQENLYNQLVRDIPSFVNVFLIPKSGGVVKKGKFARVKACDRCVHRYFYGLNTPIFPHSFDVKFSDVKIYKIGMPSFPDSHMPRRIKTKDKHTKLVPVQIGPNLLHHVLTVSFVASIKEDIIRTNVAGFICITAVNVERQVLTVLSPQLRPLPKTILLMGDIQFTGAC